MTKTETQTPDDEGFDVSAPMTPQAFVVACPSCELRHDIERIGDHADTYFPEEDCKFVLCQCGANIEVTGVVVSPEIDTRADRPLPASGEVGEAFPEFISKRLELLMKDLNSFSLSAMEDGKTHWQDGGKFKDRVFEAARLYFMSQVALTAPPSAS